jgi:hypothetical protein
MFTEPILRKNAALIAAFTGIPADEFWFMFEQMETKFPEYEVGRHSRDDRQRAVGAGRKFDQSLALRAVAVLAYLRLHVPQMVIALMFGLTQYGISRDLRRLLPLIRDVLPCPEVWDIVKGDRVLRDSLPLSSEQLRDGHALVDATEQRVSRSSDNETRKLYLLLREKESLHPENANVNRWRSSHRGDQHVGPGCHARQETQ